MVYDNQQWDLPLPRAFRGPTLDRSPQQQEEEAQKIQGINYSVCMTQFPEVSLGEKRTHWLLIVVRNANTSPGSAPFAAQEDPFVVESASRPPPQNSQRPFIQQVFPGFL